MTMDYDHMRSLKQQPGFFPSPRPLLGFPTLSFRERSIVANLKVWALS